jgi:hypothetical protein
MHRPALLSLVCAASLAWSCSRGTPAAPAFDAGTVVHPPIPQDSSNCRGAQASPSADQPVQANVPPPPALTIPADLALETLAAVPSARELAALPNGDLLVATLDQYVYLVPRAEEVGASAAPIVFAELPDPPAQGIVFAPSSCTVYVATPTAIYAMAYRDGQTHA